jgi:hypothetical protein
VRGAKAIVVGLGVGKRKSLGLGSAVAAVELPDGGSFLEQIASEFGVERAAVAGRALTD